MSGGAEGAGPSPGGAQAHQARHGHPRGRGAFRDGASGPRDDGPPQYREGLRRRRHERRSALLRHGACPRCSARRVLRPSQVDGAATPGALHPGLSGHRSRSPPGSHPSRPEALERSRQHAGPGAGRQDHRLRCRQGNEPAIDGEDALHRDRPGCRHARLHEPRAGGDDRGGRGSSNGRLLPRRDPLRAPRGRAADGSGNPREDGIRRDPQENTRGRSSDAEHAVDPDEPGDHPAPGGAPELESGGVRGHSPRGSRLDHDEGRGEGAGETLRHRRGAGRRCLPSPRGRPGRGGAAERSLQAQEVCQQEPLTRGTRGCRVHGARCRLCGEPVLRSGCPPEREGRAEEREAC